MRRILLSVLLSAITMTAISAQDVTIPAAGTAERKQLLEAVRAPLEQRLHQSVRFVVRQLKVGGGWAFLHASMQDADGHPINYVGTEFEGAAEEGLMSKDYVALLKRSGDGWTVQVDRVGPSDVAWTTWAHDYGAPEAIFSE